MGYLWGQKLKKNLICDVFIHFFVYFLELRVTIEYLKYAQCGFERSVATALEFLTSPRNSGSFSLQMIHQTPGEFACIFHACRFILILEATFLTKRTKVR